MFRINQFILYMMSFFKKIDEEFLFEYLNSIEIEYFNKLLKTEKQHSIRVAKRCLDVYERFEICDSELNLVVKMCLLHDIGKQYSNINLFLKPFIVIGSYKEFRKILFFLDKDRVKKYFNHPKYSFEMLRNLNYSTEVLNSIKYHHSKRNVSNNKYLKLLRYCDT